MKNASILAFSLLLAWQVQAQGNCTLIDLDYICQNYEYVAVASMNCACEIGDQECIENCLEGQLELTVSCVECFVDRFSCAQENCFLSCGYGSEENCQECIYTNCESAFNECAGIVDNDSDDWNNVCDCDDEDPSIYPGAEGTGQGVDNNCNGLFSDSETCSTDADNDGLCDDYDDCIGEYDNCGICNGSNLCVPGCTYPQACNFDPEADFFDFSCDFCSCLDGTEWSYIHEGCISIQDPCGAGTYWDEESQACLTTVTCAEDLNTDGIVGIADLLQLLSMFGTPCDEVETSEFSCGNPMNYHGYDYATVQIGEQCWFAENLRTEHYANGDIIPGDLSVNEWTSTLEGANTVYSAGSGGTMGGNPDEVENLANHGRLYNWYAVDDGRGLCPSGWSVPTDEDWMVLEVELGMNELELYEVSFRGTDQGIQLKSSPDDLPAWNGLNTVGFSASAGGYREYGTFYSEGYIGWFWTSSPGSLPSSSLYAFGRRVQSNYNGVSRDFQHKTHGHSIRCIKDTE